MKSPSTAAFVAEELTKDTRHVPQEGDSVNVPDQQ